MYVWTGVLLYVLSCVGMCSVSNAQWVVLVGTCYGMVEKWRCTMRYVGRWGGKNVVGMLAGDEDGQHNEGGAGSIWTESA